MSSECLENGEGEGGGFLKAEANRCKDQRMWKTAWMDGEGGKLPEVTDVTGCKVCLTVFLSYDLDTKGVSFLVELFTLSQIGKVGIALKSWSALMSHVVAVCAGICSRLAINPSAPCFCLWKEKMRCWPKLFQLLVLLLEAHKLATSAGCCFS